MNVLITDDEQYMREDLKDALERVSSGNRYYFAVNYDQAVDIIGKQDIEIAFLDINMSGKSGLEIAKKIKEMSPDINIIIVSAHEKYALRALRLFVSGYILKPVMDDELAEVLENLRVPLAATDDRVKVKCFGNFEMFYRGKALTFSRQKEKELLAYLTCLNGSGASRSEICANLFEDKPEDKGIAYLRKIVQELKKDLEKSGLDGLLIHNRNSYAINTSMLECDYYDYLSGVSEGADSYHGEFMNQYSWAEMYIYGLENF